MSFATVTPENFELTPCRVSWLGPGDLDYTDLGGTLDNVLVKFAYKKSALKADQFGDTDLDSRISGMECTIEFAVAETADLAKFAILFPHATKLATGGTAYNFNSAIGASDLSKAGVIKLHPLSRADSDQTRDWTAKIACPTEESEVIFSPTEQQKLKCVFKVYPDTSVSPPEFLKFGDPAVTA